MKNALFISQTLDKESSIVSFCKENDINLQDYSLLKYVGLPFQFRNDYDWIFFYSSHGIKFFFDGLENDTLLKCRFACLNSRESEYLQEKYGVTASFVGEGVAIQIMKQFEDKLSDNDAVCFVEMKNPLQSMTEYVSRLYPYETLAVYEQVTDKDIKAPNADIIILTSPLNAKAYFSENTLRDHQIVIAYGSTTKKEITNWTEAPILKPLMPSEKALQTLLSKILSI